MASLIAQNPVNLGPPLRGIGPLGDPGADAPSLFASVISSVIGLLTIIAFIWFLLLLVIGAIGIMTAGGDKAALETARKRITTGLIGVVIVIAATFVLNFVATLLGVPNILDIPAMIQLLSL